LSIFLNSAEKVQVSLKSEKNTGYFTWRPKYIYIWYLYRFFWELEIFQKNVAENIKTHFLFNKISPKIVLFTR